MENYLLGFMSPKTLVSFYEDLAVFGEEPQLQEDIKLTLQNNVGEEETEEVSVDSIKSDINVSDPFISKAIKQLKGEGLIKYHNNFISLTERGKENARDIVKKHRILENYVKETKNGRDAHKVAHILEHYVSKEVIDNIITGAEAIRQRWSIYQ